MTDSTSPIRVVAAVIRRDGRYLLCLRPRHKRHGGLWEFPGGKLLAGETIRAAVARELAEELGVDVLSVGKILFLAGDPGSPFVIEFVETGIDGEPEALEHERVEWFAPGGMARLPLAPADRRFVEEVLERSGL